VPSGVVRQRGAALVLVLSVALLLGLAALSLTFAVTLDSLSARNAQEAALAEGQAEGGLAIGTRLLYAAPNAATGPAQTQDLLRSLGWSVQFEALPVATGVVQVKVKALAGRAVVFRSATVGAPSPAVRLLARY